MLSVDNSWFTLLTQNVNPIHFDHAYAAQTEFGQPLVDSTFTLALVTGQSTIDLSFNVMANLGWDEVRLPNPLFEGDTVYSRSEVLEKRESKSRPNVGIVKVKTTGFKQDGLIVIEFFRTFMVYKRDHVPPGCGGRGSPRTETVTRDIDVALLRDTVARLIVEANYNIPADILDALARGGRARGVAARRAARSSSWSQLRGGRRRARAGLPGQRRRRRVPRDRTGRALGRRLASRGDSRRDS